MSLVPASLRGTDEIIKLDRAKRNSWKQGLPAVLKSE